MADASVNINAAQLQHEVFDVKAWLNGVLPSVSAAGDGELSDDTRVSKLLTRLQVHHQEVSTSLEDLISQALVRLPRTALEVERLTADTLQLSKQLTTVVAAVEPQLTALPSQARDIARLDRSRAKLVRCSQSLQKAKLLTLQLEELESSAKGTQGQSGGATGSTMDLRVESFANAISDIQESLRELQRIDPSYGADIQGRVHILENDVQKSIERECLDLLRRQDRRRAPLLLSTLRKIGREGAVMEEFVNAAVRQRKEQFLTDLRNPNAKSSSAELVAILSSHFKGVARIISRESTYIRELFEGDSSVADAVARKIGKAFAEPSASALLAGRLHQLPANADLVECVATLHELKDAEGRPIEHALEDAVAIFAPLAPSFLQREADAVNQAGASDLQEPTHFARYLELLDASVNRCLGFLPHATLPKHVLFVLSALRDRLAALCIPGRTLPERLVQHSRLNALKPALAAYELSFRSRCQDEANTSSLKLEPSVVQQVETLLTACTDALASSVQKSEGCVGEALLVPVANRMTTYEEWVFWNAAAQATAASHRPPRQYGSFSSGEVSPSDIMRGVCEALMEVPMMLEAVNVDSNEMQMWLSRVVDASVTSLRSTLSKIVLRGPVGHISHALDQMATDVEYYHNVLNAVSEGTFQEIQVTREKLRNAHKKWSSEPATAERAAPTVLSIGDVL